MMCCHCEELPVKQSTEEQFKYLYDEVGELRSEMYRHERERDERAKRQINAFALCLYVFVCGLIIGKRGQPETVNE